MKFIKTADICKRLDVSRTTVMNWRRKGMPTEVNRGKVIRYDWEKVKAWLGDNGKALL